MPMILKIKYKDVTLLNLNKKSSNNFIIYTFIHMKDITSKGENYIKLHY